VSSPSGRIVAAVGTALGNVTATATATVRRNFSGSHLKAASHFAAQVRAHELAHGGAGWGEHFEFSQWNASAAIILSFSAIEAAIDEMEDDIGLPLELTRALEKASTLDHAQAILAHRDVPVFDRGAEPFQSVELLRALRNGLVHPKAEWDNDRQRNRQLSRKINGAGLPLSPFQQDPDLAFPHGCMSAGIAAWAEMSARSFIRELRSRLGLNATV